jgi:hypothetical protein
MPKRSRQRKHTPFGSLPLHQRRSAVVRLGWRIACQTDAQTSRIFWTDHLLQDPDAPDRIHTYRLEAHYRATDMPVIGESFSIDRSYAYGIGLHAVVAESNLDRTAIERTITRFREMGECNK